MHAYILPVLNKSIQIFKEPPEHCADREKHNKVFQTINYHAVSRAFICKRIYDKYEREP